MAMPLNFKNPNNISNTRLISLYESLSNEQKEAVILILESMIKTD